MSLIYSPFAQFCYVYSGLLLKQKKKIGIIWLFQLHFEKIPVWWCIAYCGKINIVSLKDWNFLNTGDIDKKPFSELILKFTLRTITCNNHKLLEINSIFQIKFYPNCNNRLYNICLLSHNLDKFYVLTWAKKGEAGGISVWRWRLGMINLIYYFKFKNTAENFF